VSDHLKCYKIKDSLQKTAYTADLGGLAPEPGCRIKVPAKMLCIETAKENVQPPPPGGGGGGSPAGTFVCYQVKCPKAALPSVDIADQFGTRAAVPSAPKLLCAPTATTSTTTTSSPPTTCGQLVPCCFFGQCQLTCSAICPIPSACTLGQACTITTSSSTTTTLP
jgi:hypothetical protein